MKNDIRRYCRRIRSWLPCPGKLKNMILGDIRENVQAFAEENSDADMAALYAHFGAPQQIAASYVADLDMPRLLRDLRLRKRIFTAVMVLVSAALITADLYRCHGFGICRVDHGTADVGLGYPAIHPRNPKRIQRLFCGRDHRPLRKER